MSEYKLYPGYEIFPVKSKTACLLKWSWSTIILGIGQSKSCHRVKGSSIDPDNFGNFHNLPEQIKARELMLQGEWPGNGCEYCKNVEDHNGVSDRIMTLTRQHGADKVPPELFDDPTATSVTPTVLEIYFNNTCNLSCVYCSPTLSSRFNDETRKFGDIKIKDWSVEKFIPINDNSYNKMVAGLWNYLTENDRYKIIRQFQILGGESLLQKELDQCISFWQDHPNPALTINLISNLMLPYKQFVEKMSQFEKLVTSQSIYILELTASLDCWGPEQEYTRYGIDLDTWTKNFEYLLDKPWVRLSVHSCITVLSIKTFSVLINKITEWNKRRPADMQIDHSFDFVIGGKFSGLHPTTLGPGVFDADFEKIISLMPVELEWQKNSKEQMQGLAKYVKNTPKNTERIAVLVEYLDELDRRRNTNWRTTFPWLNDLIIK
jgi:hypothetical protein